MRERGGARRSARAQRGTRVRARVSGRCRGAEPSGAVSRCCAALTACDRRLMRLVPAVVAALRNACAAVCACVWCLQGGGEERAAEKVNDQRGGCERWGPTMGGAGRLARPRKCGGHARAPAARRGADARAARGGGVGARRRFLFFFFFLPRDAAEGHGSARRPPWCTRTTARSRLSGEAGGRGEGVRQRTCELARAQGGRAACPAHAPASPAPERAPRRPQLPRALPRARTRARVGASVAAALDERARHGFRRGEGGAACGGGRAGRVCVCVGGGGGEEASAHAVWRRA